MRIIFLLFYVFEKTNQENPVADECFGINLQTLLQKYCGTGAEDLKNIFHKNPSGLSKSVKREWDRLRDKYCDEITE